MQSAALVLTVVAQHWGVPLEHEPLDEFTGQVGTAETAATATAMIATMEEYCILSCLGFSGGAKECVEEWKEEGVREERVS